MGQPADAPGRGEVLVQVAELEEPVPLPSLGVLGVRKPQSADFDPLQPLQELVPSRGRPPSAGLRLVCRTTSTSRRSTAADTLSRMADCRFPISMRTP